jgi:hypothetical protein
MPRFVTALFEQRRDAEQAIAELQQQGFNGANIQHVDREREREGFFDRLFLDENGGARQEDITLMGIARARVEQYARLVRSGLSLVIVMCSDENLDDVRAVLGRYNVVDIGSLREGPAGTGAAGEVDEGIEIRRREDTPKWFEVVEIDETDRQRRGARSHAVHVQPKRGVHHESSEDMPGAHRSRVFEDFLSEFQVHYAENFAGSDLAFEDYELAYRYGVRLVESPSLRDLYWEDVEEIARNGWEDNTDKRWSRFGEAVKFGWRRGKAARRSEDDYRRGGRWTH